jgi:glucosamine--fructose-6-phosphate aminotransferase (isomerizing)
MINPNFYVQDILTQPQALRKALEKFDPANLTRVVRSLAQGDYDRIIITGMGASLYGAYPAWLHLTRSTIPSLLVDSSELLHYTKNLLNARTLLWVLSQSGLSAEIVALLEVLSDYPVGGLLAITNEPASPLAQAAEVVVFLHAEPEKSVSTRTYLNTLALAQLVALALLGVPLERAYSELGQTVEALEIFLQEWEQHLQMIGTLVGQPKSLVVLGRGPSLANVYTGALVQMEAAKFPALAIPAGQFRHGPLEFVGPRDVQVLLAGEDTTSHLQQRLYDELTALKATPLWLECNQNGNATIPGGARLPAPSVPGVGLPLGEILPLQLLSVYLAQSAGREPGQFRYIPKVTLEE